jgi:4-diphosphocytidyl-2-C-methyl-D-erythritol kinase
MTKIFCPIKLNLSLDLIRKRADGYHDMDSLVTFLDYGDHIEIQNSDSFGLVIKGNFAKDIKNLAPRDNLVYKAYDWMVKSYPNANKDLKIILHKNIPIASGLGGGSSDAAGTIYALLDFWNISLDYEKITDIIYESSFLGADLPVCLAKQFSKKKYFAIQGTGKEKILELDYDLKLYYLLVNPLKPLSTKEVFQNVKIAPVKSNYKDYKFSDNEKFLDFIIGCANDLETPSQYLVRELKEIKNKLEALDGCLCARMSGSGATYFAVFQNYDYALKAYEIFKQIFPDYWQIVL